MGEEEDENPNSMYIPPDILKQIFLRLPLRSLGKFKSVSKEWISILESNDFVEMHLSYQKSGRFKTRRKILAADHCDCGAPPSPLPESRRFEGLDGEEFVYLHCDATRPSLSCDGLVCIPEPGWVNILNPATRQLRRFPSGPDPVSTLLHPRHNDLIAFDSLWARYFPGYWGMGFGREKVTGSYKVVRMFFDPNIFEILDVNIIGKWRKLNPPPYPVHVGRKSVYLNGSIYWFEIVKNCKILALDLHTEEFHDVAMPARLKFRFESQIVNLEERLAIVSTGVSLDNLVEWEILIWSMDEKEERWSQIYHISLHNLDIEPWEARWFAPVTVSKYYPHINKVCEISPPCVILSPYLENLVRLESDDDRIEPTVTCYYKDGIMTLFLSRVDKFVSNGKEIGTSFWRRNRMNMLNQVCIFVDFLITQVWDNLFKILALLLLYILVKSMPLLLSVALGSSALTTILIFMAMRALARGLLNMVSRFFSLIWEGMHFIISPFLFCLS